MTSVALFLPHLDVSGGLGVHCRMLVAALAATPSPLRFAIFSPARPQELFPNTAPEPFDAKGMDLSRFEFRTLDVPRGFSLANELDPILAGPLSAIKPNLLYCCTTRACGSRRAGRSSPSTMPASWRTPPALAKPPRSAKAPLTRSAQPFR
jgi:hypothetical protein